MNLKFKFMQNKIAKNSSLFSISFFLIGMFLGMLAILFVNPFLSEDSNDVVIINNNVSNFKNSNETFNSITTMTQLFEVSQKITENYNQRISISSFNSINSLGGFEESARALGGSFAMEDSSFTQSKVSSTNTQVSNVDEGDIVKLNDEFTFVISNTYGSNVLNIVQFEEEGKMNDYLTFTYEVDKSSVDFTSLLLSEDEKYLFIFGRYYDEKYELNPYSSRIQPSYEEKSIILKLDISTIENKNSIEVVDSMEFSQNIAQTRLYDSTIYVTFENYNVFNYPQPFFRAIAEDVVFSPAIWYHEIPQNPKTVTFGAISTDDFKEANFESYLIDSTSTLYLNENTALIVYQNLVDISYSDISKKVLSKELNVDKNLEENDFYALANEKIQDLNEKEISKLNEEIEELYAIEYEKQYSSTILKFDIDKEKINFVGKNTFHGEILNQFSINENDGIVTIASKIDNYYLGNEKKETQVYTFDDELNELDVLKGIAPEEQMYSSRFYKDKLYLVTFEEIDPLFVIDLSNPKKIEILGELKIPGFSEYLHPISDDLLLGIGKDTKVMGEEDEENDFMAPRIVQNGVKISLFDVSDVNNPKELDVLTFGNSWGQSLVAQDHKAFLIDLEEEYFVVPMQFYEDSQYYNYWYGAVVVDYSNDELKEIKRLSHDEIEESFNYDKESGISESSFMPYYYDSRILRTSYVDSVLYTYSSGLIVSHDIKDSFETLDVLQLTQREYDDEEIYY